VGQAERTGTFQVSGRAVSYTVRRNPRARRVWIRVGSDGTLVVVFPRWGRLGEAPALLEKHRAWVEKALERHGARALQAGPPFGSGSTVLYRGRALPLRVEAATRRRVRFSRRGFVVLLPPDAAATSDERQAADEPDRGEDGQRRLPFPLPSRPSSLDPRPSEASAALETWYRARAATVLAKRVSHFARQVGHRPGRITVRDTRSRWGSCSPKGTLSFTWRLLMAPPAVLDYVVLHELCHLVRPDHSARFWALVGEHCPDYQSHRKWLRHHTFLLTA